MGRCIFIVWLLIVGSGCGADNHVIKPLDIYNDTTVVITDSIHEVIAFVNTITPEGSEVDLDDYWMGTSGLPKIL